MEELFSLVPISFKDHFLGYGAQVLKSMTYGEDRITFGMLGSSAFVCVLDGHGGDAAAELARVQLGELMQRHQGNTSACFSELDAMVEDKSGACALVVELRDNTFFVSSLGDCSAFLFQPGEGAIEMSKTHSVEVIEEQERMKDIGGITIHMQQAQDWHPEENTDRFCFWFSANNKKVECVAPTSVRERLGIIAHRSCAVSRSIGDHSFGPLLTAEPELAEFPAPQQCLLILGSDGFFDQVTPERVQAIIDETVDWTADPRRIREQIKPLMRRLCTLAFEGWGGVTAARDDISLIVTYCGSD